MIDPEEIDKEVERLGWDKGDKVDRFCALAILRRKKQLPHPTWDDFKADVDR